MANLVLNRNTIEAYRARVEALREDSPRQWGTLSPHRLLRHLNYVFQMTFNEVDEKDISKPFVRDAIYYVFFEWFTNWPKGKIKAPDSFTPEPEDDFETERARVLAYMDRFVEALETNPDAVALSPLLGHISYRRWEHVHGSHLSHHLKQFGV